jgi:hypothetical protein
MNAQVEERELSSVAGNGALATISRAEIDQQVATARAFPRSIKHFRSECMDMVTLTERIAEECIYALPRDGKTIEGPSARFAEIIASAWGNCRAGARVVGEDRDFVIAQGAFHDMERNVHISYEVKRRIVDKHGNRFKPDMIGVTANAACSIALRNAILKGVPKAFWSDMYDAARRVIMGDSKTLATRRADAMAYLQKFGATEAAICKTLAVPGIEDIGLEHLVTLKGIATAIKDGDTTVEQAFGTDGGAQAKPLPPKPDGYDEWLANLEACADNGGEALDKMWASDQPGQKEYRAYLTATTAGEWERIKAKAAEVQ